MFLTLVLAALQAVALSPAEVALTQAHAGWLGCLTAEARPIRGAPPPSEARLEGAFRACRTQEAAVRARAVTLFGPAEGDRALARYREDARGALMAVPDPLADATRAWGACLGGALPRTVEARGGRSDREVAEAAFTACLAEERAARAVLATSSSQAEVDQTFALLRAQILAALPQFGVPPARP